MMATPPDFSVGQVLTAAQMNAVGLWRVTTCTVSSVGGTAATASNGVITIGNGNTSVTVSNAFSADFDNYRVVLSNASQSATNAITFQLGTANTDYSGFMAFGDPAAGNTVSGTRDNAGALFTFGGGGDANSSTILAEVIDPFLTKRTEFSSRIRYGTVFGNYVGYHNVNTSFTAFTIAPLTGSFSGGTLRVYGYRN